MTQARFKGWLFFFSGLLLSVCCFLPIVKMVATKQSGAKETFYTKLMPSLPGFLVLMLAVACCIIALVGYKQGGAIVGTLAALSGGGILWYTSFTGTRTDYTTQAVDTIISGVFGTNADTIVDRTYSYSFGFYLMIIAVCLVLFTGFMYALSEDD
ncbi:hypothetical protein SAMN06296952_0801 [Oscillospiraceae bacterium]|nr:hypothetical protein SAMN06296952_0801 [Oscillospiraceae bacterium]